VTKEHRVRLIGRYQGYSIHNSLTGWKQIGGSLELLSLRTSWKQLVYGQIDSWKLRGN